MTSRGEVPLEAESGSVWKNSDGWQKFPETTHS
jgi:hypothetical protein